MEVKMSDRVGLKELANVLVSKNHLTAKEAENFVALLFETLNEGLKQDKQVKVKGLGTFKVTSVSARKSIDVNTGEPILIEGRDKISFVADTIMRDIVNKPFAQFETVVINDGIDFADIDTKYQDEETDDSSDDMDNEIGENHNIVMPQEEYIEERPAKSSEDFEPETSKNDETNSLQEEPALTVNEKQLDVLNSKGTDEIGDNEQHKEQWALTNSQLYILNTDVVPARNEREERINKDEVEPETIAQTRKEEAVNNPKEPPHAYDGSDDEFENESESKAKLLERDLIELQENTKRRTLYFIVAGVLFMLIAGMAMYYFSRLINVRDNRIAHLETLLKQKDEHIRSKQPVKQAEDTVTEPTIVPNANQTTIQEVPKSATKETELKNEKAVSKAENTVSKEENTVFKAEKKATLKQEKVSSKQEKATTTPQKSKVKANNQAKNTPKDNIAYNKYDSNPRVRTGAYRIVGVDKEIVVREGQTLYSISRGHLGPGMECYVEAINGGITTVKVGQKIKIPKLELRKKKG